MKTIIQIGSNDGSSGNDSLYQQLISKQLDWNDRYIFIEPHPLGKSMLEKTYSFLPNKEILNIAIGETNKLIRFYTNNENKDNYISPHSSLHVHHLLKIGHKKEDITYYYVPMFTFETLLESLNITEIDQLYIDTEGYDRIILETIDFNKYNIKFLEFEIIHFDGTGQMGEKLRDFINKMKNLNYSFIYNKGENAAFAR